MTVRVGQCLIKKSVVICVNLRPFVIPKAREVFGTLGFKVRDFSTSVSKTGSGDVWIRGDEEGVHKKYNENVGNFINYI